MDLETARKEILRHLQLGKSIRSPGGETLVRNFIAATQLSTTHRQLLKNSGLTTGELCTAFAEVVSGMPDPLLRDADDNLLWSALFGDPEQLADFLTELRRVTHAQALLHRQAAITACARKQALLLPKRGFTREETPTRSVLMENSIQKKLPVLAVCTAIIIIGILLAVYFLMAA